jgi:Skp family chaperone for outer membrane proteins
MSSIAAPGVVAVCGAVALGSALAAGGGPLEQTPGPLPVAITAAVVETSRVLRSSHEWRDASQERLQLMDQMRRTVAALSRQVQLLRNEYENLPPGTDEKAVKQHELARALAQVQREREGFELRIAQLHNEASDRMLRRIAEAAREHAEQNGLSLVLRKESPGSSPPTMLDEGALLATTEVLYADPALDITDAIIDRVNAAYAGPIEVK